MKSLRPLLEPLESFDRLHTATLRRFGNHLIDLSYPNPRVHIDPRPYQALAGLTPSLDDLRYSPFGGFTLPRREVAAELTRQHGLAYNYRDVVLTPGATVALRLALRTLFTPADRVIVVTPCWMDYPLYLADLGIGCDLVPAAEDKHLDLAAIERAWTPRTRGIIISQPVSPTGVCYRRDELDALTDLLRRARTRPVLISDETHRDQVWGPATFHSPVTGYADAVSVYSFGKAWQMQGQRIGYLAVSPAHRRREELREELSTGMRVAGYCAPTALMQHLVTALRGFHPETDALARLHRYARDELRAGGFDVVEADATHFVYVRSPVPDAERFSAEAAGQGVLVMPSTLFHEPGYFRIALNVSQDELARALKVLANSDGDHRVP